MITYNTKIKLRICDIQLILEKLIDRVYKTWLIDTHFWRSNYAKWRLYLQISFSHNQLLQKFRKTVFILFQSIFISCFHCGINFFLSLRFELYVYQWLCYIRKKLTELYCMIKTLIWYSLNALRSKPIFYTIITNSFKLKYFLAFIISRIRVEHRWNYYKYTKFWLDAWSTWCTVLKDLSYFWHVRHFRIRY